MGKFKKLLLVLLVTCAAICVAVAVASCASKNSAKYPNFKNPAITTPDDEIDPNAYQIEVTSKGGLPLDGVRVAAVKDGSTVISGISINGKVQLRLPLDEYELRVSDLPAGYYLGENDRFMTSSKTRKAQVQLSSKIIDGTAPSGTSYNLGDIMYDFSFGSIQYDGSTQYRTLKELFTDKKAVFLNFWYKDCGPCKAEFPAIETAYGSYSDDVAFVALTARDSVSTIADFKENYYKQQYSMSLTFDMGQDLAGLGNMFGISAYPTTVVVDRYGMIVYKDSGTKTMAGMWRTLFETYTADDYKPNLNLNPDNPDEPVTPDRPLPNVSMPKADELIAKLTGAGAEGKITNCTAEDDEYAWPFLLGDDANESKNYIAASNTGIFNSYSILNVEVQLDAGDILSYEYNVYCKSNVLRVILNRETDVASYSEDSEGWKDEYAVYIANRPTTVTLYFCYLRQSQEEFNKSENEHAYIGSIYITNISSVVRATDAKYTAVTEDGTNNDGSVKYAYPEISMGEDGYYRLNNDHKSLLLADIYRASLWSQIHLGSLTVTGPENSPIPASLYNLSYWDNRTNVNLNVEGTSSKFVYNGTDYSNVIFDNFYIQQYSESGLVPVDEELKVAMQAFTKHYCTLHNLTYYEDQWLELCSYYLHYGNAKGHNNEKDLCYEQQSTVEGLVIRNALPAELDVVYTVDNYKEWTLNGGGVTYKFEAPKDGVYRVQSLGDNKDADPVLYISDANGESVGISDDDLAYDNFLKSYYKHFCKEMYLQEGTVMYFHCSAQFHGDPQKYDFKVSYVGDNYSRLIYCSTGDGAYSYNQFGLYYLGIDIAYDALAGYYRAVGPEGNSTADGTDGGFWSPIYIDFVRPNFFDLKNHSIKWMIDNGEFNFKTDGNFTAVMRDYYNRSVEGKDASDPTYGLIEADQTLVDVLNRLTSKYHEVDAHANGWLSMACFYAYYGYDSYAETQNS